MRCCRQLMGCDGRGGRGEQVLGAGWGLFKSGSGIGSSSRMLNGELF